MERVLRVEAPHFVAGAVWVLEGERWRCVTAAPILRWMINKPPDEVKKYLSRRGWGWAFLPAAEGS